MSQTSQNETPLQIRQEAWKDMVENVSIAGWREAFGEHVIWIRRVFQISLLILSGFCLFYLHQAVAQFLDSRYKDVIDDVADLESLPFSNVTICAQVYFNQSYVREQIELPREMIEKFNKTKSLSLDDLHRILSLYLPPIIRPRDAGVVPIKLMQWAHATIGDYSAFTRAAFPSCESMLKKCVFDGKEFDCCTRAAQSIDDDGICYVITLNFDSDNAVPSNRTVHQTRSGPRGGLYVEASLPLEDFPMLGDDADNGFKVFVNANPYTLVQSPVVAPDRAVTYVKVTPARRMLASNCASHGNLKSDIQAPYHDPDGIGTHFDLIQKLVYRTYGCNSLAYQYVPNGTVVCSPYIMFIFANSLAADFDQYAREILAKFPTPQNIKLYDDMSNAWRSAFSTRDAIKHCDRWTYSSMASFHDLGSREYPSDSRQQRYMYSRIHVYYGDLAYRHYSEEYERTAYVTFVELGGVIGLYWGMSIISIFHVLFYVPRYTFLSCKARKYGRRIEPSPIVRATGARG